MMKDRELLEYITTQVGSLTTKVDNIDYQLIQTNDELKKLSNQVTNIEDGHGKKLDALISRYCCLLRLVL